MNRQCWILLVDDSPADLYLTRQVFERVGSAAAYIYAVEKPEKALALCKEYEAMRLRQPGAFPPMAVVLDLRMPGLDGFEFAQQLPSTVQVVVLTGMLSPAQEKRLAQTDSVIATFRKPLQKEHVEWIVDKLGEPVTGEVAIDALRGENNG